ncbi:MAG: hypothetical protein HOQ09_09000, partial [Gemmatimonadaceae bacterium]|nr:hypothetical protein [Gemmatimonadaceae bacterium]
MPGIARGYRRSSLVIGAVIVFVLGGLYATDRALTQASRERLRVDAAESATLVESFLSQRAEALVALRAIYADGQVSNHRAALSEYTVALTDFLPGIRRLWIADSSGKIVDDVAVTGGEHLPAADMDTIHTLGLDSLAAHARSTARPLLSAPGQLFGDTRGVVMMMPLCGQPRRRCAGFIAALLSSDAILATALRPAPIEQSDLLVLAGNDTVTSRQG